MVAIGALMMLGAATRSDFVVYRLLRARAEVLWKDRADTFLLVSGSILIVVGGLWAAGVIWS